MIKLRINPLLPTTYHLPTTNRGFTIIELVIVITIMAILLTLGVVNLRGSQANGRDAERKTDIETIAQHLETYFTSGTDVSTISSCTGGNITHDGLYTVHTFTSSGTLTCTGGNITAEVLVVAGGGGGGYDYYTADGVGRGAGGGGAGGYLAGSETLSGSMAVTVGDGGGGAIADTYAGSCGRPGQNSVFLTRTAIGGGGGIGHSVGGGVACSGNNGGSGGGGNHSSAYGTCIAGQGHDGSGGYTNNPYNGGGGGGAGAVGEPASGITSGDGGAGLNNDIVKRGTNVGYSGGGGGAGSGGTLGVGGLGDGGDAGMSGTPNTGGGGGAGHALRMKASSPGGSGVVVIRYLTAVAGDTYPSTVLTSSFTNMTAALRDIDTDSLMAPGISDPTQTFISATNNTQTTVGVLPQPTKDQYVYQPLHTDGSLCNDNAECSKFNLYYRTEVDNTVQMVSSIDQ